MPSVGLSIRCVVTLPCGDTGSWSTELSPFAGITSVNSRRALLKRFPNRLRQPRSQRLVVLRKASGRWKNQRSTHHTASTLLTPSPASGSGLAGAVDYAATLLESVV